MKLPPDISEPGGPLPAQPIELIALDLDGTCLNASQELDPRIRDAVHRAIAAGVTVVVATGRGYRSALVWANELGVTAPLICYAGAMIRALPDPDSAVPTGRGRILEEHPVDPETALRVLEHARAHGWHFQAYRDDETLCEQDRPEAHLYATISQRPFTVVGNLEAVLQSGSIKVVCVVEERAEAQRCEDSLRNLLGGDARVTRSLPPFIEVTSLSASKGQALESLCRRLGIEITRTAAVGDAPNDIDMLDSAGFAVAVATKDPRLLAVADALCAPPDQAGVADVLGALVPATRLGAAPHFAPGP